jgi:hypothetical protein
MLAERISTVGACSFNAAPFAVIAYRLQADRFGDLDHATKQVLDRTVAKEAGPAMAARLASFDQKRTELSPSYS